MTMIAGLLLLGGYFLAFTNVLLVFVSISLFFFASALVNTCVNLRVLDMFEDHDLSKLCSYLQCFLILASITTYSLAGVTLDDGLIIVRYFYVLRLHYALYYSVNFFGKNQL